MLLILQAVAALVPLVAQDDAEPPTGWLCRVGTDGPVFRTPHAGFDLEAGESLHPLAPASAPVWFVTLLEIEDSGTYEFVTTALNGEPVVRVLDLDGTELGGLGDFVMSRTGPLSLDAGEVRLLVGFRPVEGADRRLLNVAWRRESSRTGGFPLEPIPNNVTRLPDDALDLAHAGDLARRGRVLLEERGCTDCHTPPRGGEHAVGRRLAPDLHGIGARADVEWLTSWIRDPAAHGSTGMPRLLWTGNAEHEARSLAHYVASLSRPEDLETGWAAATEPQVVARGRELYHQVGCVACHGALESAAGVFNDPYLSDERPETALVPLDGRANKWRASALAEFLLDPVAVRPDGRMPSMGLSEEEADYIATYLIDRLGAGAPRELEAAQIDRGRGLFTSRGCDACHVLDEEVGHRPMLGAPGLIDVNPEYGCLVEDGGGPRYTLTADEKQAMIAALAKLRGAQYAPAPLDAHARRVEALNCTACHEQNGAGGIPEALDVFFRSTDERVDLGDEGRLPPEITGVGSKLTAHWMEQVLTEGARARPYLGVRMPSFGEEGAALAEGLARAEGSLGDSALRAPEPTDASIRTGRELLGPETFSCMTCHVYGDFPATGSPGPAITQFAERLRYDWFYSYMHNPQRYKPGGRMPDFSIAGKSSLTSVLDGDLAAQINAMWSYFELGEFMPAPDGVEAGDGFPLPVGERPVVHRGFLLDVGARGIAVGLPVGVHFAFDARTCRLVHAWKGAFIDASGSWAGRGGSQLGGQGPIVWEGEEGPTFEHLYHHEVEPEFRGYRLDADGWPTFQWTLHDVVVHESFDAALAPELVITRRFEFENLSGVSLGGPRLDPDSPPPRASGGMIVGERHGYLLLTAEAGAERPTIEWEVRP